MLANVSDLVQLATYPTKLHSKQGLLANQYAPLTVVDDTHHLFHSWHKETTIANDYSVPKGTRDPAVKLSILNIALHVSTSQNLGIKKDDLLADMDIKLNRVTHNTNLVYNSNVLLVQNHQLFVPYFTPSSFTTTK